MMRVFLLLLSLLPTLPVSNATADIIDQANVRSFIDEMVEKHQFDRSWLEKLFRQASIQPRIIKTMNKPAEKMPWYKYRRIFIRDERINKGIEFYRKHKSVLERAETEFRIPAEILLAIVGVETLYGERTGGHQVIDALSTLAFNYPKRANFFRNELEQLLLLVREEDIDPFSVQGSYAGAIGQPQFMPSSYREYAIDYDGDGQRDLQNSVADTIGSVANYLKRHGWQAGGDIVVNAKIHDEKSIDSFLDRGLKPSIPFRTLNQNGVQVKGKIAANELVSFIQLEASKDQFEYWIGEHNFYVITRYNHSPLYALAVVQLARAIKQSI